MRSVFPGSPLIFLMLQTLKRHVKILGSIGNLKVIGDSFELFGNCPAVMVAGKAIFSKMLNSNRLHFLKQIVKVVS
jgi:hypothetical protein